MSQNTPTRFMPSPAAVADLLYAATTAFPTWAVILSSAYLMLLSGLQAFGMRRVGSG